MRQLDQRRVERRGDGRPSQQAGWRCGADVMELRAQFEGMFAAESHRHGRQRILLLLRELSEVLVERHLSVAARSTSSDSGLVQLTSANTPRVIRLSSASFVCVSWQSLE